MASLPIPGEQYLRDFSFDMTEYSIEREGKVIAVARGLDNKENGQKFIHFPLETDVAPGDVLISDTAHFNVRSIETDTYDGTPSLLKILL